MPNHYKHSPADPHPIRTFKQKGNAMTNCYTEQGCQNWDQVRRSCGCKVVAKCDCQQDYNFVKEH